MIRSDNFYGRETGSVRGTQAEWESEQLAGGVIVCKSVETRRDWRENKWRGASWVILLDKYDSDDQIKEDGMGGESGTYVWEENCIEQRSQKKRSHF